MFFLINGSFSWLTSENTTQHLLKCWSSKYDLSPSLRYFYKNKPPPKKNNKAEGHVESSVSLLQLHSEVVRTRATASLLSSHGDWRSGSADTTVTALDFRRWPSISWHGVFIAGHLCAAVVATLCVFDSECQSRLQPPAGWRCRRLNPRV